MQKSATKLERFRRDSEELVSYSKNEAVKQQLKQPKRSLSKSKNLTSRLRDNESKNVNKDLITRTNSKETAGRKTQVVFDDQILITKDSRDNSR